MTKLNPLLFFSVKTSQFTVYPLKYKCRITMYFIFCEQLERGKLVLHNQHYNVCPVAVPKFDSFECLALSVSAPLSTALATVYRPP